MEVNGVDFTSVDHKEVRLLNEIVGFYCYMSVLNGLPDVLFVDS